MENSINFVPSRSPLATRWVQRILVSLTISLGVFFTLIEPQIVVEFRLSLLFRLGIFRYIVVFNILIVLLRQKQEKEKNQKQLFKFIPSINENFRRSSASSYSSQRSFASRILSMTYLWFFGLFWRTQAVPRHLRGEDCVIECDVAIFFRLNSSWLSIALFLPSLASPCPNLT